MKFDNIKERILLCFLKAKTTAHFMNLYEEYIEKDKCSWEQDIDNSLVYSTGCCHIVEIHAFRKEKKMRYCLFCGRLIDKQ